MKKQIILFITLILVLFAITSCKPEEDKPPIAGKKDVENIQPVFKDNPKLISLNGYQVTKKEFMERVETSSRPEMILRNKDEVKNSLRGFVEEKVFYDKAKELGYDRDPDYIKQKEIMEKQLQANLRLYLVKLMFNKEIDKQFTMDEKAVKNFYKKARRNYEKRAFSEILRVVKDPEDEQEVKKVEKEIYMIYEKLQNGEKFEKLAAEYYNGNPIIQQRNGILGMIRPGKYPDEFEYVGYEELKEEGEISKPFLYNQGWSIIRLDKIYGYEAQKEYIRQEYKRVTRTNINRKLVDEYLRRGKWDYEFNEIEIEKMVQDAIREIKKENR